MVHVTPNASGVLVCKPFECAWLHTEDFGLHHGSGCVSFRASGNNDITVLLKSSASSSQEPTRYCVVIGSHRNTKLKLERLGVVVALREDLPAAALVKGTYAPFWIKLHKGSIAVGGGCPGTAPFFVWRDPAPLQVDTVGLGCWDAILGYKDIAVQPVVEEAEWAPPSGSEDVSELDDGADCPAPATGPRALASLCTAALRRSLSPHSVGIVAAYAQASLPLTATLRRAALAFLQTTFASMPQATLAELPYEVLRDVISSHRLDASEITVFHAVAAWGELHPPPHGEPRPDWPPDSAAEPSETARPTAAEAAARGGEDAEEASTSGGGALLQTLLQCTRFPLMNDSELRSVWEHPLASSCAPLRDLLLEASSVKRSWAEGDDFDTRALRIDSDGCVRQQPVQHRLSRRVGRSCRELLYLADGDDNGVVHHLATWGRREWMNPAVTGRVTVTCSGATGRYSDPKSLVDGQYHCTLFTGPRLSAGQLESWWCLDLGEQRRLCPNYYSLRRDSSGQQLESWVLQGSTGSGDAATWHDLCTHRKDTSLSRPARTCSWPISGPAAAQAYRMFRVWMLAPPGTALSSWKMCLSNLELYGYLYTYSTASNHIWAGMSDSAEVNCQDI